MGGKSSTTTQKTELPPEIVAAYKDLLAKANPVAETAYKPYTGGVDGTGMEQNQLTGFNTIANLQGSSNPEFGAAAGNYMASSTPSYANVGNYMNPYVQNVVNATQANMNESNAEQQQGVLGNAAALGALGGNRVGVAQAELARQQNLANQQTIAGLYNQGYSQAMTADQQDKALQQQAASGLTDLGKTAMQTDLAQAAAQVGAGTQQQQWNYQQYQNALSYPYQNISWLSNIVEGLGAGRGTTTTTQPAGNTASGILGGVLGLASLFNKGGAVHDKEDSARPGYAPGGVIPYTGPSGIVSANNNNPPAANDNGVYVPQAATGTTGVIGPAHPTPVQQQPDQGQQMLQTGINAEAAALKKQYPNGILAGAPQQGPTLSGAPLGASSDQSGGLLSKLGGLFGFAHGGVIKGYADGGDAGIDYPGIDAGQNALTVEDLNRLLGPTQAPVVVQPARPVTPTPGIISADTQAADARLDLPNPQPAAPALEPPVTIASDPTQGPGVVAPDQSQGVVPSNIPVPTPRPYRDPQVASVANTGDDANAGAGVVPNSSPTGVVGVPANSHLPSAPKAGNQQVYDPFMNTVRTGFDGPNGRVAITNPNALAAIASTGIHESGFAPNNAYGDWQDGKNRAGGIMSWNGDRLANLRSFVKQQGGSGNGTAQQQAQFFLQEDPGLIDRLNKARSPQEAQQIMNNAWAFKGYNQPGNKEAAARIRQAVALAPQFSGDGNATIPAPTSDAQLPNYSASSTRPTTPPDAPQNAHAGILGGTGPTTESSQTNLGGIFGNVGNFLSGKGGHLLNLSDDQRMALLSAGLGMMAGTSPNALTNIGTGGLKGVEAWNTQKQRERENALAASNIETQKSDVALRGKQLALEADKAKADIGQQTAQTAGINTETAIKRWNVTNTPQGMLIRDATNPTAQPQFYSWQNIQANGLPPQAMSNETIGAQASGAHGTAPASATPAAPTTAPNNAPVTAAPTQPVGAPQQFVTKAPDNIPFDGRNFSTTGTQLIADETKAASDKARTEYQAAQSAQVQINEMKHDLATIGDSAWTMPGAGFKNRVNLANAINTTLQAAGFPPAIDPNSVGAGQDLNKLSTRLGFDLSQTLGSREAASTIDQAVSAVPGGYNSKEGAQRIIAGIEAANQRKMDYYTFLQDWQSKSGGSIKGADEYFNQVNPPEKYANQALLKIATVPRSQADIDNAPPGTMFNDNGILRIKK